MALATLLTDADAGADAVAALAGGALPAVCAVLAARFPADTDARVHAVAALLSLLRTDVPGFDAHVDEAVRRGALEEVRRIEQSGGANAST
jgi:hypothetical protein